MWTKISSDIFSEEENKTILHLKIEIWKNIKVKILCFCIVWSNRKINYFLMRPSFSKKEIWGYRNRYFLLRLMSKHKHIACIWKFISFLPNFDDLLRLYFEIFLLLNDDPNLKKRMTDMFVNIINEIACKERKIFPVKIHFTKKYWKDNCTHGILLYSKQFMNLKQKK